MNFEKQYVWMISEKLDGQNVINIPFADMWSKVIIVSTIMDGNSHRYLSKEEEKGLSSLWSLFLSSFSIDLFHSWVFMEG